MKVGDFVRSKVHNSYGLVLEVRKLTGLPAARVLWQGIACDRTWEFAADLVSDVESELTYFAGCK